MHTPRFFVSQFPGVQFSGDHFFGIHFCGDQFSGDHFSGIIFPGTIFLWDHFSEISLRINLRTIIREFLKARDLPNDLDIKDEFVGNKMSKQKRCNSCPSSLDRKTSYKCLRCDKAMCKEHVAKICCECAENG